MPIATSRPPRTAQLSAHIFWAVWKQKHTILLLIPAARANARAHTGAWFCLPPAGQTAAIAPTADDPLTSPLRNLLTLVVDPRTNHSLLWARRDLLGYEWECGATPAQCYQCSATTSPPSNGMTPDQFNQALIVQPLFVWQPCPSGYYCPRALDRPTACPARVPWSPPGSANVSACACPAGSYLSAPGGVCVQCPDPSTACGGGQYLAGWMLCQYQGGATSPGVCTPCTNKPASAAYLPGAGVEVLLRSAASGGGGGYYGGACPFVCPPQSTVDGTSNGCLSAYTCTPLTGPLLSVAQPGVAVYSAALQGLADGFQVAPVCGMQRNLSAAVAAIRQCSAAAGCALPVSASCAAATPAACVGAPSCAVTRNATYFADYACAPCPPPPANGALAPAPLALACGVQCLPGFALNRSDGTCIACTTLDLLCGAAGSNMHVVGGGCYGGTLPFAVAPSADVAFTGHYCAYCQYDIVHNPPPAGMYLDLSDAIHGCVLKQCIEGASVGVTVYIATECGGSQPYVTAPCLLDGACTNGTFMRGARCTRNSTAVCAPCTTVQKGYYKVSDCGATADAVWLPCGVSPTTGAFAPGFYCTGDGAQRACPSNRTSLPGASSVAGDCVCPAGTTADAADVCRPARCADAAVSTLAPGAGWRSAYYAALDPLTGKSQCYPCSPAALPAGAQAAFTLGDGVGPCVCPAFTYASSSGGGASGSQGGGIVCLPCGGGLPPPCTGGGGFAGVPNECWTGRMVGAPTCACLWPPFMSAAAGGACAASGGVCAAGFSPAPCAAPTTPPGEHASGSALFARNSAWATLLLSATTTSLLLDTEFGDYAIGELAVTSDYGGWGDDYNLQYALWTLQYPWADTVFSMPLPPHNALQRYDPYNGAGYWRVVPANFDYACTVDRIAVAQWPLPQTAATLAASFSAPADVAAVVTQYGSATTSASAATLWLYMNQLSVDFNGFREAAWLSVPSQRVDLQTSGAAPTAVAVAHAYIGSGAALTDQSTFFVALNDARGGVICAVRARTRSLTTLTLPAGDPLSAMAVRVLPDGAGLYVARAGAAAVQLVRWANPLLTQTADAGGIADELFLSPADAGGGVRALSLLAWPSGASTFFALLSSAPSSATDPGTAARYRDVGQPPTPLRVADLVQRTFVEVQDVPFPTAPSAFGVTGTNTGAALLVGANTSTLFTLAAGNCNWMLTPGGSSGVPQYWDGAQCRAHACVRARACLVDQGQFWDATRMQCACVPGYYAFAYVPQLACAQCAPDVNSGAGFYCPGNGSHIACPSATMTSPVGATAASDCVCRAGQYYVAATGACATCRGGSWCPNQWSALACPGAADPARSDAGYAYPKVCRCAAGYVGVRCDPCPAGLFCPITGATKATNNAVVVQFIGSFDPCPLLTAALADYFGTSSLWYLRRPAPEVWAARVLCVYVPAPVTGVPSAAMLMVQTDSPTDAQNSAVLGLPAFLASLLLPAPHQAPQGNNASSSSNVYLAVVPASQPSTYPVENNTALACPGGKSPSSDATTCVCAPGFETSQQQCSGCSAGSYKAYAGPGVCLACPLGASSPIAASACVGVFGNGGNSTDASGLSQQQIYIIAGGVAGGVAGVGLLVWGLMAIAA